MDEEAKLKQFLEQQLVEPIGNIGDFELWQARVVSRLSRHLDPKTHELLRKFKEISPTKQNNFPLNLEESFTFNTEGLAQAKGMLRALMDEIDDVGLSSRDSAKPARNGRKREGDKASATASVVNVIQQGQSQTINVNLDSIFKSELGEEQFEELKRILEQPRDENKKTALYEFFRGVSQSVIARILTSILIGSQ